MADWSPGHGLRAGGHSLASTPSYGGAERREQMSASLFKDSVRQGGTWRWPPTMRVTGWLRLQIARAPSSMRRDSIPALSWTTRGGPGALETWKVRRQLHRRPSSTWIATSWHLPPSPER